jgi:hypothetical protein
MSGSIPCAELLVIVMRLAGCSPRTCQATRRNTWGTRSWALSSWRTRTWLRWPDRLVDQLRERGWDGDEELGDALDHVMGRRASTLRPLLVELDDVGEALSQQAGSENYLDLQTGTVWFHTMSDFVMADDLDVDFSDESRWLFLLGEGSHADHGYQARPARRTDLP